MNRNKKIVRISIYGIITNIVLVIFKSIIGIFAHSIAIILDAVNNLSDVLSSLITIAGTALASKKPDKEHPYGHGRIEYFSSILISVIVLGAGVVAIKESIDKIINPVTTNYGIISLIIIFTGIFVKYFLGTYYKREGKKLHSNNLIASGVDALGDAILALSTFICALISYIWNVSLDGYVGIIISIIIIKTAFGIFKNTINDIIGIRVDANLSKKIKDKIKTYNDVIDIYDLMLHSYGPNNMIGSANIEVDASMKAIDIHKLTKNIEIDLYEYFGIIFTLGIYASNEEKYNDIKNDINNLLSQYKNIIEMHGFYVDDKKHIISFDLIFDFKEKEPNKIKNDIIDSIKVKYPKYDVVIILDRDFTD